MPLHVVRAECLGQHHLHLWFNDGSDGQVDLSTALDTPIYQRLNDPAFFRQFRLEGHTVAWENGADFAPEYLYSLVHASCYRRPEGDSLLNLPSSTPADSAITAASSRTSSSLLRPRTCP